MKRRLHSFTLLELLAVVTLLGLLAGYTMRGLLQQPVSAKETLRRVAAIDAEARLLARRHGPLSLSIKTGDDGDSTVVVLARDGLERSYLLDHLITVEGAGVIGSTLGLNRHGQSVDYTATVADGSGVLHVAGLTGWSWIDSRAGVP